jgi:hypothetical protein
MLEEATEDNVASNMIQIRAKGLRKTFRTILPSLGGYLSLPSRS